MCNSCFTAKFEAMGGEGKSAPEEDARSRMGLIQQNDLVYQLEPDLSVAVNRTHKTGFFQSNLYDSTQSAIAIFNTGADYVDPRRSFLTVNITLQQTAVDAGPGDWTNTLISANFGPNGSVLNLIDSVVVSTRSGDELSRVNDFGQMWYHLLPAMFGEDWRHTVGQQIGLGSFLGGSNNRGIVSELRRQQFTIPLYLLSPIFSYGRLLPSMLTSGLRVEIKWKPLTVAVQQFWEGAYVYPVLANAEGNPGTFQTEGDVNLVPITGASALASIATGWTAATTFALTAGGVLTKAVATGVAFNAIIPPTGQFPARQLFIPGVDSIVFIDATGTYRYPVIDIITADTMLIGSPATAAFGATAFGENNVHRISRPFDNVPARDFGARYNRGVNVLGTTPLTTYTISNPQFSLCCVQLSDAIQRTLNEYSAVNGLEIVYADWDRTSAPLGGAAIVPVYTEVRKSASRVLGAFATVVDSSPIAPYSRVSQASYIGGFWNHYQWQLGSLYFPQQRVQDQHSVPAIRADNMITQCYAYFLDAFDKFHPKAAPTMLSMRGWGLDWNRIVAHPTEVHAEHNPDTYLVPSSPYGHWGSFAHGNLAVATTLERSSMFDLSGIPTNNSRVLALRGEFEFSTGSQVGTLFIFCKYVRLARVFLINTEVEQ